MGQKHHTWIQSTELGELTASEGFTLEQDCDTVTTQALPLGHERKQEVGKRTRMVAIFIPVIPSFLTLLIFCFVELTFILLGRQLGPTQSRVEITNEDIRVAPALLSNHFH